MARRNDSVKVRTGSGAIGWVDARLLLEPALWQRSVKLLNVAKAMPVQARGRTKVQTNLRVEPGRTEPRLYQFGRGVPVEVVARAVADWVQVSDERENNEAEATKKEDWFLVRGLATRPPGEISARSSESNTTTQPGDQTIPIAGWVVARFVELDLPEAVREGMGSANVRPTAWVERKRGPPRPPPPLASRPPRGPRGATAGAIQRARWPCLGTEIPSSPPPPPPLVSPTSFRQAATLAFPSRTIAVICIPPISLSMPEPPS